MTEATKCYEIHTVCNNIPIFGACTVIHAPFTLIDNQLTYWIDFLKNDADSVAHQSIMNFPKSKIKTRMMHWKPNLSTTVVKNGNI